MAHWLVQGNPAKWRAYDFFADGNQLESWSITRYRDRIQPGDGVALWLPGRMGAWSGSAPSPER
jgi:hypothetical protein